MAQLCYLTLSEEELFVVSSECEKAEKCFTGCSAVLSTVTAKVKSQATDF